MPTKYSTSVYLVHWKFCHNLCFALQLARQGFKVVLISRTKEKLESLAVELSKINRINNKQIISCSKSQLTGGRSWLFTHVGMAKDYVLPGPSLV